MKNSHKHFIARLLVGAFLIFGIGFRMSNFVVKAATWTLDGGGLDWTNTTSFLNSGFWNEDPSPYDIITALYGTGDEGSIYTTGWDGYNASTCLDDGMTVVYTGVIPTTIDHNVIYVLASGTYNITTGISMANCSALISSGTVTLSGSFGGYNLLKIIDNNNIIIEKINITNNDSNAIYISSGTNLCMNEIKIYNNENGIYAQNSSYGKITNSEIYNNTSLGLNLYATMIFSIDITNIYNNNQGVFIESSIRNILSGVNVYNNTADGITLTTNSNLNTLKNLETYGNDGRGIYLLNQSSNNTLDTINSYNNNGDNIYLSTTYGNTLTNIIANASTGSNGIRLSNSSGTILSGITASGNSYHGIYFNNSSYNTGTNITGNNNYLGLYLDNSSENNFTNFTMNNNYHGVGFSESNYNILSGLVSSGSTNYGMVFDNSSYNTGTNIISNNNEDGLYLYYSSGNNFTNLTINSNSNDGVYFSESNYNTLSGLIVSGNINNGMLLENSSYTTGINITANNNDYIGLFLSNSSENNFTNLTTNNNIVAGVYLSQSNYNALSGLFSSGNMNFGIYFYYSSYTTGTNITANNNDSIGLSLSNSSKNNFTNLTTNNNIYGIHLSNSSGTILSGITASGNASAGIYLNNSSYNTGTNITANNNDSIGLSLLNSSENNFTNITTNNNYYGVQLGFCFNNQITNSTINNNYDGIYFGNSNTNIISGSTLSGNTHIGIYITTSINTTITNTTDYYSGVNHSSIYINGGTGYFISSFIGSGEIQGYITSGINYTNINNPAIFFDTFTQDNNYINFTFSPYATLTGNTISSGTDFVSYTDDIRIELPTQNGYENFLQIYGTNTRSISGADRDGKLYAPLQITTGTKQANLGETGISFVNSIVDTIEVGTTGDTYLIVSGGQTVIYYYVLSGTEGQNLKIFKSTDGETRSINSSESECLLDPDLLCSFTTTGTLKLFAFGTPELSFSGITLSNINVVTGGYYNTGITITFTGSNISGHTLSGVNYTGGTLITGDGTYVFVLSNTGGYTAGMTFTIDTVRPTISGVISGAYYNTGKLITGSDDKIFSGFMVNGTFRTGTSLTVTGVNTYVVTGYDKAGNTSTGITFMIDTTYPSFTGTLASGSTIVSGGYYNTTGITITFTDTYISGARLSGLNGNSYLNTGFASGTTITTGGTYRLNIYDIAGNATGMTFTIDTTNPIVTGAYVPSSGSTVSGSNTIVFSWSGIEANISGYNLYINLNGTLYATGTTTGATTYTKSIGNNTGYTRYVLATDKAGNTGISSTIPFSVSVPLSGIIALSGTTIQWSGSSKYVSNAFPVYLYANITCSYTITGDITTGVRSSGILTGGAIITFYPVASGTDGLKNIYVTLSTGNEYLYQTLTGYLDTTKPTDPVLSAPTSGSVTSGMITLTWSAATDTGVGLSGYRWYVSSTGTFTTISLSGFTTGVTTTLTTGVLGNTGTFYRVVRSLDKLGWSGQSSVWNFYYSGEIYTPTSFSFTSITNASLDRTYRSSTGTIAGLSTGTYSLARASRGALYINSVMTGSTGYVKNGDTINIELISSDEYDTLVSSTLTIGNLSVLFRVTTMNESDNNDDYSDIDTDLSSTEKLQIIAIFETLRDLYEGTKAEEFLNTLMVMLENNIEDLDENDTEYDALKYLYDLVEQYYENEDFGDGIGSAPWIVNGVYTAPNGKRYTITYDSAKRQFTSTNFITPKYFPTLDTLKYLIDISNPVGSQYLNARAILARWGRIGIDGTRQTSPYTAPNHKVYYFFKTIEGEFSSYTFTSERYFDSLEQVKEFIYTNNR